MLTSVSQKFSGSCFLLVRKDKDTALFLGTAFLVHEKGYLLTAAHLMEGDEENLMAVRPQDPDAFSSLSMDRVAAMELETVRMDKVHNTALLKFKRDLQISTPDYLLGNGEDVLLGTTGLCLGFPFGHDDLYNLAVQRALVSSKVLTTNNQTKLLLIDTTVHDGMAGGPFVSSTEGRVIGILTGRFSPSNEGGGLCQRERASRL